MSDEAARKLILARRARFIAAAVVGAGVSASEACTPQPCLEPPIQTSTTSAPQPCLSPAATIEPTTAPSPCLNRPTTRWPDAGARDAGPSPPPAICLTKLR